MSTRAMAGPPRVQIQTQSGCNGKCVFCPNEAVLKSGLSQGRMPPELFQKIIDELAETRPRRISLYLMNEPLLDLRLPDFVRYTTDRVPDASTLITTNGTNLDEGRAEALIDAGLKRLKVSLQSLDPEQNRAIMGYSSERVIRNVLTMKRVMDRKRACHLDLRVSMIVTTKTRDHIEEVRRFWAGHGIRLVTSALENRGGNIALAGEMNTGKMRSMGDCIRPSRDLCILYNGDVPLCCVDWHRTTVLGNVGTQSVREVWNGARLVDVRSALHAGDAGRLPAICVNCTESACPNAHRRGLKGLLSRPAASL